MTEISQDSAKDSVFVDENGAPVIEMKQQPSIYIFRIPELDQITGKTSTKVGYTVQAPTVRTNQWKQQGGIYETLIHIDDIPAYFEAENGKRIYYMDHAVHRILQSKNYDKLINVPGIVEQFNNDHISQEFYYNKINSQLQITKIDLNEYVEKLRNLYNSGDYPGIKFYEDFRESAISNSAYFSPVHDFDPRSFQQNFIDNSLNYFVEQFENFANSSVETSANYLLSAPTRSGKSFMSATLSKELMNYLYSKNKEQNLVLVVSGIADVGVEWQETYEAHKSFNQRDENKKGATEFVFITRNELLKNGKAAIDEAYSNGAKSVVVFLTLQDLSGTFKGAKNESFTAHDFLKPVDGTSPVDFMIIDEAHFAAFNRYGEYRSMIARNDYDKRSVSDSVSDAPMGEEEFENVVENFQAIQPTLGTLYVSATPYNELINSDMFSTSKKNMTIISKQNIKEESNNWILENPDSEEWFNPCYGLPSPNYFAIDTGEKIDEILEVSKDSGKFVQYNSANSMIWNFFGYKFENDFLFPVVISDPVYKNAGLGNHIIVTVPSCLTADAVEESLTKLAKEHDSFDFKIMNVSSDNSSHYYRSKSAYDIKREINDAESDNVKTVVITVDRLTTGVTVKQWDTVVFWRKMSSAQKHDQLSGRNGTPYVVSMVDAEGGKVKRVEKQNVAVISYAPEQMLDIAYQTAVTMARVKQEEGVSDDLKDMIESELSVSPTYVLSGGDTMVKMNATNILDAVLGAQKGLGPREYAEKVSLNVSELVTNAGLIQKVMQISADDANLSLSLNAFEVEEIEEGKCQFVKGCETEPVDTLFGGYSGMFCKKHLALRLSLDAEKNKKPFSVEDFDKVVSGEGDNEGSVDEDLKKAFSAAEKARKDYEKRIRNMVSILLMFVALSNNVEHSLKDVINSIEDETNHNGRRIAKHLGIDVEFLKGLRDSSVFNTSLDAQFYLIDGTLSKINELSSVDEVWNAVNILVKGFGNFSNNEIPTPDNVAELVVDKLGLSDSDWLSFNNNGVSVIDNGSKSAVMLVEFARRAFANNVDSSMLNMFAVPTSPATYELVRKVYELLGWNLENILFIEDLTNFDVLDMLELAVEKRVGCQKGNVEDCFLHGNSDSAKKRRKDLGVSDSFPKQLKRHSDEDFVVIVEDFAKNVEVSVLENIFDKIVVEENRILAKDFWERIVENIDKFDYAISNPPYQDEKNNPIFQHFQNSGNYIAEASAMIYMASRWWYGTSGLSEFKKQMMTNKKLKEVVYFNEIESSKKIFDGTGIAGGISIVVFSKEDNENFELIENLTGQSSVMEHINDNLPIKSSIVNISKKIRSKLSLLNMSTVFDRNESAVNLLKLSGEQIQNLNPIKVMQDYHNNDSTKVKIYANISGSKGGKSEYYLIDKTDNLIDNDKYKVCIGQSLIENENRPLRLFLFDNETYFGRSAASLAYFKSKEEASNFYKYASTNFFEFCLRVSLSGRMKTFASYVPDFIDYTNSNKMIDWEKPLDSQLYELFELTSLEIEQINAANI